MEARRHLLGAVFALIEHAADERAAFLIRVHDTPLQQKLGYYEERERA